MPGQVVVQHAHTLTEQRSNRWLAQYIYRKGTTAETKEGPEEESRGVDLGVDRFVFLCSIKFPHISRDGVRSAIHSSSFELSMLSHTFQYQSRSLISIPHLHYACAD